MLTISEQNSLCKKSSHYKLLNRNEITRPRLGYCHTIFKLRNYIESVKFCDNQLVNVISVSQIITYFSFSQMATNDEDTVIRKALFIYLLLLFIY